MLNRILLVVLVCSAAVASGCKSWNGPSGWFAATVPSTETAADAPSTHALSGFPTAEKGGPGETLRLGRPVSAPPTSHATIGPPHYVHPSSRPVEPVPPTHRQPPEDRLTQAVDSTSVDSAVSAPAASPVQPRIGADRAAVGSGTEEDAANNSTDRASNEPAKPAAPPDERGDGWQRKSDGWKSSDDKASAAVGETSPSRVGVQTAKENESAAAQRAITDEDRTPREAALPQMPIAIKQRPM